MSRTDKKHFLHILKSLVIILCTGFSVQGQEHSVFHSNQNEFRLAQEQFDQGNYRLALQTIELCNNDNLSQLIPNSINEMEQAKFIRVVSKLKLDKENAVKDAKTFMNETGNVALQERAAYYLGQYFFKKERLAEAIPFYEQAKIDNLTNTEIIDLKFELAYCYFNNKIFEKAEQMFASIKDVKAKYYSAGNYYYGLLAYNFGRFDEALSSFRLVEKEQQYAKIVPYYIAEIYYFKGDRKTALELTQKLIEQKEKLFYDNELYLLSAQILFEDQDFKKAIPFFEHYYDNIDKIRKEELYEMAYSYYKVSDWKSAVEKFKPLSIQQDSLGQTAMYLLGDCYLKMNDRKNAKNAFGICSDMNFNDGIREAALLLYGKLSFEMGNHEIAMNSFNTLLTDYPKSTFKTESKTLVGEILVRANDYAAAYNSLKDAKEKNSAYWAVWQKATLGYGLQELKKGNLATADTMFSLSLLQSTDKAREAVAYFWKADIDYGQKRYKDAVENLKNFIKKAEGTEINIQRVSKQATLSNAYLNLGYASMELEDYKEAKGYFSKTSQPENETDPEIKINATIREADASFMQKGYKEAARLYEKVIDANVPEADYARIQKAIIFGLQGKPSEKIKMLQTVVDNTNSQYNFEARFELANTYMEEDKFQHSINFLAPIIEQKDSRSNFPVKALMKTGFAYEQLKNDTKATEIYRRVLAEYPTSKEKYEALNALKSIYIEHNHPESYTSLLNEFNLPEVGSATIDSTYYSAAEAQIANENWVAAKAALMLYLKKFQNGIFATKANYYIGESHYQLNELDEAINSFDDVLKLTWNEFTETSAKRAADISFNDKKYEQAMKYFVVLRSSSMSKEMLQQAYLGMTYTAFYQNDFKTSMSYADTVLSIPDLPINTSNEVLFLKAKIYQQQGKASEAMNIYNRLKDYDGTSIAPEIHYRIAELFFKQNKLKDAESEAAKATEASVENNYFVDKAWLLIVDILLKEKDYFNAKATLQSIIKNTKNADLKKEAKQKLEDVKRLEKQQSKLKDE